MAQIIRAMSETVVQPETLRADSEPETDNTEPNLELNSSSPNNHLQ